MEFRPKHGFLQQFSMPRCHLICPSVRLSVCLIVRPSVTPADSGSAERTSTFHVTLNRHSCMGTFSNWMKSGKTNTDFHPDSFVENSIRYKMIWISFFDYTGVKPLSVWLVEEIIWTWVVKKQERWERTSAYWRENRQKRSKSVIMSRKTKSVNLQF